MASVRWDASESLEARGVRFVGHSDLGGFGDANQLIRHGRYLYVGHMRRAGTSILDLADPERPDLVWQESVPVNTHSHKVQVGDGLLIVNHERIRAYPGQAPPTAEPHSAGIQIYSIGEDPASPRKRGFLPVGGLGIHRLAYTGGAYAYLAGEVDDSGEQALLVADVSDPDAPKLVGRWDVPSDWAQTADPALRKPGENSGLHHVVVRGDRAYGGLIHYGFGIFDVSQPTAPRLVSRLTWPAGSGWGGFAHTALPLPGRPILATTEETTFDDCAGPTRLLRLLDVSDEEHPREIAALPEPAGDYCARGGRFGPHNLHEQQPGSLIEPDRLYAAYFNAGLRIYDVSEATAPREIGSYVPAAPPGQRACQINDVYVDAHFVYISDRVNGGVWILEQT